MFYDNTDEADRIAWDILERQAVRESAADSAQVPRDDPRISSEVWLAHEIAQALRKFRKE